MDAFASGTWYGDGKSGHVDVAADGVVATSFRFVLHTTNVPSSERLLFFLPPVIGIFVDEMNPTVADTAVIFWNPGIAPGSKPRLVFRREVVRPGNISLFQWYWTQVQDGVFVGRFSELSPVADMPNPGDFSKHVVGWHKEDFDVDQNGVVLPHTYLVSGTIDGAPFDGGLLQFGANTGLPQTITGHWNGSPISVIFTPSPTSDSIVFQSRLDVFQATSELLPVAGQSIPSRSIGGSVQRLNSDVGTWRATRTQLLGYGPNPQSQSSRDEWQVRTRKQITHIIMDGNPKPINAVVTIGPGLDAPAFPNPKGLDTTQGGDPHRYETSILYHRDDGYTMGVWPQYQIFEVTMDLTFNASLFGSQINAFDATSRGRIYQPYSRRVHAYVALPYVKAPEGGYRLAVVLNGHNGSAYRTFDPGAPQADALPGNPNRVWNYDDGRYWYGDAFARQGYFVLSVDISHRERGDSPLTGNDVHPAIIANGFNDSDWEQCGERAWDVMRAIDVILGRIHATFQGTPVAPEVLQGGGLGGGGDYPPPPWLPSINPKCVVLAGLSMGGEITTYVGGLDPDNIAVSIPCGFAFDTVGGPYDYHWCFDWLHADLAEYLRVPDYYCLTAPRGLIVMIGKGEAAVENDARPSLVDGQQPTSDCCGANSKALVKQSLIAYAADFSKLIHYIHYDAHQFHVGDVNPFLSSLPGPVGDLYRASRWPGGGFAYSYVRTTADPSDLSILDNPQIIGPDLFTVIDSLSPCGPGPHHHNPLAGGWIAIGNRAQPLPPPWQVVVSPQVASFASLSPYSPLSSSAYAAPNLSNPFAPSCCREVPVPSAGVPLLPTVADRTGCCGIDGAALQVVPTLVVETDLHRFIAHIQATLPPASVTVDVHPPHSYEVRLMKATLMEAAWKLP